MTELRQIRSDAWKSLRGSRRVVCLIRSAIALSLAQAVFAQTYLAAPFANRSTANSIDWIGESIGESLRAALEREQVSTVPREERERFAQRLSLKPSSQLTLASLLKVSDAASANGIIWGDYDVTSALDAKPTGESPIRITARVYLRMAGGIPQQTLEVTEAGVLEDLAAVQRAVAWAVFRSLKPSSRLSRAEFDARHPARKVNALENYVRGLIAKTPAQRQHYFAQAVRQEPVYDEALFELGLMRWREEEFGQAIQWLARVTPAAAEYQTALFLLGSSQFHQGDAPGALKSFSELALRAPGSLEVRNNLAAAQLSIDAVSATEAFAKIVEDAPGDPDYLFNYGYSLWSQGQFERAAEMFRAVLDRTPNEGDALLMLGRCLKKSGPRPGDLKTAGLQRLIEEFPTASRPIR